MHKIESRDFTNRKYLSKTILACRERQAKKYRKMLQMWETMHSVCLVDSGSYVIVIVSTNTEVNFTKVILDNIIRAPDI